MAPSCVLRRDSFQRAATCRSAESDCRLSYADAGLLFILPFVLCWYAFYTIYGFSLSAFMHMIMYFVPYSFISPALAARFIHIQHVIDW